MKKVIFTLCVDNYQPEITKRTFPLMQTYAQKIGADFHVITERKYPAWPAAMEKLQVRDLAEEQANDWNLFFDADALIHPDCFDITEHLTKDTVLHHALDRASIRFDADRYFRRDGRFATPGNWCTIASDWCLDLWEFPRDLTPQEAARRIHPTVAESVAGIDRSHLIDDYIVGRNAAKYGLKVTTFHDLCERLGLSPIYFWHMYAIPESEKIARMDQVLAEWNIA